MGIIPLVDLKKQYKSIESDINESVSAAIQNANFILGPQIEKFEKDFAEYCNAKYCIALSSGTSALEVALKAIGIRQEDEVITVPNTFIATAEAIINAGATPIFAEIDESTFNIDIASLKDKITKKTKAVIPVDLYGHPCDLGPIMELAEKHSITVIEDACQAHGAEYNGKKIGGISHATSFSFYPGKILGAYGDAGALATNDEELSKKVCALRDHGRLKNEKYIHNFIGNNYRMDELQAAVLNAKLKYLDKWVGLRREVASKYNKLIKSKDVKLPEEASYAKHAYHLYVIRTAKRDKLKEHLKSKGIMAGVHYPSPLHLQPALRYLGYKKGGFKIAEACADSILSLPIYPELEDKEIEFVSESVNEFLNKDEQQTDS